MAAVDVSAVSADVLAQIEAVTAVGGVLLTLWVAVWAIGVLRDMFALPSDAATSVAVVTSSAAEVVHKANTAEYDRLGAVWQGWRDQIDRAAAQGGVAPAARQNMGFYDALVSRGMDPEDAIAAVEARNAAVARSEARADAADQRRADALADAHDAAEHAAAIERYQSQPVDLTVRLGGGWK